VIWRELALFGMTSFSMSACDRGWRQGALRPSRAFFYAGARSLRVSHWTVFTTLTVA
jgi:hypothetical protein